MVSVHSIVRLVTLSVALLVMTASVPASAQKTLNALNDADLLDLLDAELDESFLAKAAPRGIHTERLMQGTFITAAPTPAPAVSRGIETPEPTGSGTASPTAMEGLETAAPTVADRGLETSAPTSVPATEEPVDPPVASGVWRPVPSVAMAFVVVVLAALSGGAFGA